MPGNSPGMRNADCDYYMSGRFISMSLYKINPYAMRTCFYGLPVHVRIDCACDIDHVQPGGDLQRRLDMRH